MSIHAPQNYQPSPKQEFSSTLAEVMKEHNRTGTNSRGEAKTLFFLKRTSKALVFTYKSVDILVSLPKHRDVIPGHQRGKLQVAYRYKDAWVPQLPRKGAGQIKKEVLFREPHCSLIYKALYAADLLGFEHPIARWKYFELWVEFLKITSIEQKSAAGRARLIQLYLDMIVEDLLMGLLGSEAPPTKKPHGQNEQGSILYHKQPLKKLLKDRPHHEYTLPEALRADDSWVLELS